MAAYSCKIELMIGQDRFESVDSHSLVPGDIVSIKQSTLLPCDMVLLSGSCIINEAMLTGESIPVIKAAIPNIKSEVYSASKFGKHTLFDGTKVLQTRPTGSETHCLAMVTNTGFQTSKGGLIRDILYPKEINFQFESDGYKLIAVSTTIALIAVFSTVPSMMKVGTIPKTIVDNVL
jgi:cation-transporting ATPase 13A3/4/5